MMKPYPKRPANRAVIKTGVFANAIKAKSAFIFLLFFIGASLVASGQLGIYQFTGTKLCPTQGPNVTLQPLDAVFGAFTAVNVKCKSTNNVCNNEEWNKTATLDLTEYLLLC